MKKAFLFFFLLSIAVSYSFSQNARLKYGPADAEKRILLAFEPTRFKDKLLEHLVDELNDSTVYIEVIENHSEGMDQVSAGDYDVVFISNSGVTAKVRPWITDWLEMNRNSSGNIIVHTTQRTVWVPQVEVDSVTSASLRKNREIKELSETYAGLIRKKLEASHNSSQTD